MERAVHFSNLFSGSSVLFSFELARGYVLAIVGNAQRFITQDIQTVHEEQTYTRSMKQLMRSRNKNITDSDHLLTYLPVIFYYKYSNSKRNEPNECKEGIIHMADE